MGSGIYQITNTCTGEFYVGSAVDFDKRWHGHLVKLRCDRHHNNHLRNAFIKYGESAFTFSVLELVSADELLVREQHYIDTLSPVYNICKVAGSRLGAKHTEESIAKMSAVQSGKIISDEQKDKIRQAHLGMKMPDSTREAIAKANKGSKRTEEQKARMSAALKGRVVPEEQRKKMSEARKAYFKRMQKEGTIWAV